MRHLLNLFAAFVALLSCMGYAEARGRMSIYNSPKGFGFSYLIPSSEDGKQTSALTFATDMYGVLAGVYSTPGFKFNVSKLGMYDIGEGFSLFAGPGFTAGYARDFHLDDFLVDSKETHERGIVAALSATGGLNIAFDRAISLAFSLTAEAGIHIRKDRETSGNVLSIYKNGVYRFVYPEVSIILAL